MKTLSQLSRILAAALLVALPSALAKTRRLPQKPAGVIKANFPDARITGIGKERERGAWYYEVVLHEGKRRFEVEITDDGVIGEIEAKVMFTDLPPELQQKVRQRVGRGRLVRVEKHERRGVARSGKFVPLSKPRISYEIKYYNAAGERRELQLDSNQVMELPAKVRAMLAQRFPDATIEEAEVEDDSGVLLHVVSLRDKDHRFTVVASSQGDLVEYEVAIEPHALPQAARHTLEKDSDWQKAKDPRVVAWETFGAVEDGKLVSRRDRTYMVTLRKNGQIKEYRFDGRGRVTSKTDWTAADDDDDGGDEGDDDD